MSALRNIARITLLLAGSASLLVVSAPPAAAVGNASAAFTETVRKPFTGDFDAMVGRRLVRILVVPSQTYYFVDRGTQRGLAYDFGRAFEEKINQKRKRGEPRVEVIFIPVHRDDLLKGVVEGRGDIAIGNLTITPERERFVDFSVPFLRDVKEIVVTGPESPEVRTLDDLSGKTVFVRPTSSYFQSLWHLNESFSKQAKAGVAIESAPEQLEDEDILEMLNAGLVDIAIVDDHKARFWAQVLPGLRLHPDVAVRTGAETAWAFRKQSPQLASVVNEFARMHAAGTAFGNQKLQEYLKSLKYVKRARSEQERKKLFELIAIFRKYADQYAFDWLMVAAQGYQESGLDHGVRSRVGAIGIMQVMPATGRELGVGDIRQRDANIHAGTKYLRRLIDQHFSDPAIDPLNRTLFAFAGYNAGPNRVAALRKKAASQGLDPNRWFGNVERVVAREVGQEPVRYVANIYKYYVAYRLVVDTQREREAAEAAAKAP
ncbi:membrane-bound lytic murein transglycosylase F [Myxococcaceae bacterium]|jgi:membrane-bound lytic murein transglycosylase MltF|nr:membrane-bound lytic murein transglycosylase F [Myxococcaceae bacterium]